MGDRVKVGGVTRTLVAGLGLCAAVGLSFLQRSGLAEGTLAAEGNRRAEEERHQNAVHSSWEQRDGGGAQMEFTLPITVQGHVTTRTYSCH